MRRIVVGALGLLAWMVTQCIAVGLGGAGHGLMGPLVLSALLLPLYPLVFVRAFAAKPESPKHGVNVLVVAAALDLILVGDMALEGDILLKMWRIDWSWVTIWIALWTGWQVLTLATLLKKRHVGNRTESASF